MSETITNYLVPIFEILWIDIVLSGDNAIVVALACSGLPNELKFKGILFGTAAAIGLRTILTLFFVHLLGLPFINLIGGLFLIVIAVKFACEDHKDSQIAQSTSLLRALRVIILADLAISLDNVIAIGAASKGSTVLIVLGLALSIPPMVAGSSIALKLLARFPSLIWASVAVLGFVAGQMIGEEFASGPLQLPNSDLIHWTYFQSLCGVITAVFVVLTGLMLIRWSARKIIA